MSMAPMGQVKYQSLGSNISSRAGNAPTMMMSAGVSSFKPAASAPAEFAGKVSAMGA